MVNLKLGLMDCYPHLLTTSAIYFTTKNVISTDFFIIFLKQFQYELFKVMDLLGLSLLHNF